MKSLHAMSAVLAALALTPVAHAVTVPSNVALAPQQDLTRQVPAEVESLDPAHIETWTGNTIGLDLFEGLARIDAAGQCAVQPKLHHVSQRIPMPIQKLIDRVGISLTGVL